jgi:hypothetical protein
VSFLRRILGKSDQQEEDAPRGSMSKEESLAAYVVREHRLGRSVDEILNDPYLKNRCTEEQRLRLLERPEVIRAIGEDTAAAARERVQRT